MTGKRNNLTKPLKEAHILLTCGTGGVGKTTIAAALGMAAARLGRRTLVLTIDPAKRLANALGISDMSHEVQHVWPLAPKDEGRRTRDEKADRKAAASFVRAREARGRPSSIESDGILDCMMLDVKRTFDRVIERHAADVESAQTILKNPLYQQLSSMITGSQEYMAMEQLYEVVSEHDYDLIILDTPPSQHALDFFHAPERMVRALSDSMLRIFIKPSMMAGKLGARLLSRGAETVMRFFGSITGAEFFQEISDFLMSTVGLFGGFHERAKVVQTMLRQASTGIVLVTSPQEDLVRDARHFIREATQDRMRLAGVIINRAMPDFGKADRAAAVTGGVPQKLGQLLEHHLAHCHELHTRERQIAADLADLAPRRTPALCLAQRDHEMNNLEDVTNLAIEILG